MEAEPFVDMVVGEEHRYGCLPELYTSVRAGPQFGEGLTSDNMVSA